MSMASKLVVNRLDGDWEPRHGENPTWEQIETAIRQLDGERRTLVILGVGDPVPHMAIGGGEDGKYIVYATPDNMSFHTLVNPGAPPGRCMLTAGGQRGDYDLKICVGLREALLAAKTYAESGQIDAGLTWESS
jgi:Immunity protein Imm1